MKQVSNNPLVALGIDSKEERATGWESQSFPSQNDKRPLFAQEGHSKYPGADTHLYSKSMKDAGVVLEKATPTIVADLLKCIKSDCIVGYDTEG